jgi:hypothetical protein
MFTNADWATQLRMDFFPPFSRHTAPWLPEQKECTRVVVAAACEHAHHFGYLFSYERRHFVRMYLYRVYNVTISKRTEFVPLFFFILLQLNLLFMYSLCTWNEYEGELGKHQAFRRRLGLWQGTASRVVPRDIFHTTDGIGELFLVLLFFFFA